MRLGPRTDLVTVRIDYRQLKGIDRKTARRSVLEYSDQVVAILPGQAAVFGINRIVVY